jgi:serine/threonine protein kinase/Tol biopolymer transport system component
MGEVYKATDTRLDRTVAVKILSDRIASSIELRARFEREARAVALLDHPHICAVYDVGQQDDVSYLVMQYLEGETLAARLARTNGPLPLSQVLTIGSQLADALEKTHRAGLTHRDLKPANVMMTKSGPRLLDFGLAKITDTAGPISISGMTRLATQQPLTAAGTILGTVHYMAPEQVEGREADARTDVWALGALLYEMATGKRPFDGDSAASVIGAILKDVPPLVSTRASLIPRTLDHVVERCLAKDPDDRWQSAADVGAMLRWIAASAGEPPAGLRKPRRAWREYAAWSLAAILLTVLGITIGRPASDSATPPAHVVVFSVYPPPGGAFRSQGASVPTPKLALAPDGRHLVFVAAGPDGVARLWLRPLDAAEARPLTGTEDATDPFWSPDSRNVAFFARGALRRVDLNGGAAQVLSPATINTRGGSWSASGVILFNPENVSGLMRVPLSGGTAVSLDPDGGTLSFGGGRYPHFIGDSERFLFQRRNEREVWLGSLDSATATPLVATDWGAQISEGHLLFLKGTTLMAQAFGPENKLTGDAVPLRQNVAGGSAAYPAFSTSRTGILAYANPLRAAHELRWFSRDGTALNGVAPVGDYTDFRLSPDETRLAYSRVDPVTQAPDVWVKDLRSGADRQVTSDPLSEAGVLWSPNGDELIYRSNRASRGNQIYRVTASGVGSAEIVLSDAQQRALQQVTPVVTDWSPSGAYVVYQAATPKGGFDLWALSMAQRQIVSLKHTAANELQGSISQDSRWLAYASDESGRYEVYVEAFPDAKDRWTISTEGGSQPRWTPNGRELLYLRGDGTLMSVPIKTAPSFTKGIPAPLFKTALAGVDAYRTDFVPSADGKRILMSTPINDGGRPAITVVLNWPALLKK